MIKKILLSMVLLVATLVGSVFLYIDQIELDKREQPNKQQRPEDLTLMKNAVAEQRGKILMVLTSVDNIKGRKSLGGYELTEVSRAYYVFRANGFDVDFASPKGGNPPANIDDLLSVDYAFVNDNEAQQKLRNSLATIDVKPEEYRAVYYAGGKGTMLDFPEDAGIQKISRSIYQNQGLIAAVCHGPSALINVVLDNGKALLSGKTVTGFSNAEELLLIPDAREIFPFLLQDKLSQQGAKFLEAAPYTDHVVVDGQIISGQNPWSTWSVAEQLVEQLGYQPLPRELTSEEQSINIIGAFYESGLGRAMNLVDNSDHYDRAVIMLHGIVAAMDWRLLDAVKLLRLAAYN